MAGMRDGEVRKEEQVSVGHLSCPSEDEWLCQAGTCVCAQAGTGWAARGSSDLGKIESQSKACLAKLAGEHPLWWPAWLSRLCKAGGFILAVKVQWKGKEQERMEPGKGKEPKLYSHDREKNPYSNKHQGKFLGPTSEFYQVSGL